MTYDAFLLAGFGGPEGPDEVMPFLERVTAGRGVPRERLEQVSVHYLAMGGVSPINAQNRLLLDALRAELDRRGVSTPIYWGNRNSEPFFADALNKAHSNGHTSVLALATSAYSSYSGCRQYRENLSGALEDAGLSEVMTVDKISPYYDSDGFISAFTSRLADALAQFAHDHIDLTRTRVLFTTHSIPTSMAQASGPDELRSGELPGLYERQHLQVARAVAEHAARRRDLDSLDWRLVFQSRSGPPQVPWLEPDVNDAIRAAKADGAAAIIVVPIGFISDHMEVIWDLDNEARQTAADEGLSFLRVPTPGVDPAFVSSLVDLLVAGAAAIGRTEGLCSPTCCLNPRPVRR